MPRDPSSLCSAGHSSVASSSPPTDALSQILERPAKGHLPLVRTSPSSSRTGPSRSRAGTEGSQQFQQGLRPAASSASSASSMVVKPTASIMQGGNLTFIVGDERFPLPKPLLALYSPHYTERLAADPELMEVVLSQGSSDSFRSFEMFLLGVDGPEGEISNENVRDILFWAREFKIEHFIAQSEAFLLSHPEAEVNPQELLELAVTYNLSLLYSRALELAAQRSTLLTVPTSLMEAEGHSASSSTAGSRSGLPHLFATKDVRDDVVRTHLSLQVMCGDAEAQNRHRFADYTRLEEPKQRARLWWKGSARFPKRPPDPPGPGWHSLQTVYPNPVQRSLVDWPAPPKESQITRGLAPPSRWATRERPLQMVPADSGTERPS